MSEVNMNYYTYVPPQVVQPPKTETTYSQAADKTTGSGAAENWTAAETKGLKLTDVAVDMERMNPDGFQDKYGAAKEDLRAALRTRVRMQTGDFGETRAVEIDPLKASSYSAEVKTVGDIALNAYVAYSRELGGNKSYSFREVEVSGKTRSAKVEVTIAGKSDSRVTPGIVEVRGTVEDIQNQMPLVDHARNKMKDPEKGDPTKLVMESRTKQGKRIYSFDAEYKDGTTKHIELTVAANATQEEIVAAFDKAVEAQSEPASEKLADKEAQMANWLKGFTAGSGGDGEDVASAFNLSQPSTLQYKLAMSIMECMDMTDEMESMREQEREINKLWDKKMDEKRMEEKKQLKIKVNAKYQEIMALKSTINMMPISAKDSSIMSATVAKLRNEMRRMQYVS